MKTLIEFNNHSILHCYDCGKDYPITKEEAEKFPNLICPECNIKDENQN